MKGVDHTYPIGESPLTAAMDNLHAQALGRVARIAGDPNRADVGDNIDRGLILRRLLEEAGFGVIVIRDVQSEERQHG